MDTYPDLGISYDPDAATAELQTYLDEYGLTADQLTLTLMYNTSAFHESIAQAAQQMWADVLGVYVELVSQEFSEYLNILNSPETPQIWRLGWCGDYPDANAFIHEALAVGGARNGTDGAGNPIGGLMWWNDYFEELVAVAAVETDPDSRVELYAQAENILVNQDAVIIPIYWYTRNTLTKPYVQRTFGIDGREAYEKWDILPH
jgi:oligopeptide transport system substrate-binding protein